MRAVVMDPRLVAACGLYCGACHSYLNGKCPGCRDRGKTLLCQVRSCCREQDLPSCGDCTEFGDPSECRKFDNLITRMFGAVRNSDRVESIRKIQDVGHRVYAMQMARTGRLAIPRKR